MHSKLYLIGDVAIKTGIPTVTLNYYLRVGLIKEVSRSELSNYRYFDDSSIEKINKIKKLRLKHVPIAEIKERISNGIL